MNKFAIAVVLLSGAGLTWANVPTKTKPKPVNVAKRVSNAAAAVPANVAAVPEPELSAEHLALAQRVVTGKVPCELGAHVSIAAHHAVPGKFVLEHGRQKFHMVPVVTATGAIRLEDVGGGAVWLQLGNKSMLMDQKQGRRLADVCMNAEQVLVAQALEKTPAPSILDPVEPNPATPATVVSATK